jgi:hypothetical protein
MNEHARYIEQTHAGGLSAYVADLQNRVALQIEPNITTRVQTELNRLGLAPEPSYSYNFNQPAPSNAGYSLAPRENEIRWVQPAPAQAPTNSGLDMSAIQAYLDQWKGQTADFRDGTNQNLLPVVGEVAVDGIKQKVSEMGAETTNKLLVVGAFVLGLLLLVRK